VVEGPAGEDGDVEQIDIDCSAFGLETDHMHKRGVGGDGDGILGLGTATFSRG
jgi:hypothetical protein